MPQQPPVADAAAYACRLYHRNAEPPALREQARHEPPAAACTLSSGAACAAARMRHRNRALDARLATYVSSVQPPDAEALSDV